MGVDRDETAPKRPTMGDIAAHLGVSRQLVSAVLRDAPGASAENRARVQLAVRELGYAPHVAAQMLRRHRGRHVGVIFTLAHSFDLDLIACLYTVARERGYEIVLAAMTDTRDEQEAVRELRGFRTEGIILLGPNLDAGDLHQAVQSEPMVVFGRSSDVPGVDSVRSDDAGGAGDVVRHLLELGHRDVVHVDGGHLPGARERRAGYLRTMKAHGVGPEIRVLPGDYTEESGALAVAALLNARALPTAIMAGNDRCAVGVVEMLAQRGYRVPLDVSVTGFDDSSLARMSYRKLTTVRQDAPALARAALDAVIERIDGRRSVHKDVLLPTTIVVRDTSAPPRAAPRWPEDRAGTAPHGRRPCRCRLGAVRHAGAVRGQGR